MKNRRPGQGGRGTETHFGSCMHGCRMYVLRKRDGAVDEIVRLHDKLEQHATGRSRSDFWSAGEPMTEAVLEVIAKADFPPPSAFDVRDPGRRAQDRFRR